MISALEKPETDIVQQSWQNLDLLLGNNKSTIIIITIFMWNKIITNLCLQLTVWIHLLGDTIPGKIGLQVKGSNGSAPFPSPRPPFPQPSLPAISSLPCLHRICSQHLVSWHHSPPFVRREDAAGRLLPPRVARSFKYSRVRPYNHSITEAIFGVIPSFLHNIQEVVNTMRRLRS